MELPELPKKNKKTESDFGAIFRQWVLDNQLYSGTFELKDTRGAKSFPFKELKEDQTMHALRTKSDEGNIFKVESGIPFGAPDYVYFRRAPAFVVINYPGGFVVIDIETFLLEKERSTRKSLTWDRAKDIATYTQEKPTKKRA